MWTDASRGPSEDDDETASSPSGILGRPPISDKKDLPHRRFGRLAKQRGKRAKRSSKKLMEKRHQLTEGGSSFDEELINNSSTTLQNEHENEFEEGGITTPLTDSNSSSPPHNNSDIAIGTPNRPIRAVVANAAAISEAQHDKTAIKKRGRKRLILSSSALKKKSGMESLLPTTVNGNEEKKLSYSKKGSKSSSKISGLDLLQKTTMDFIHGTFMQ